jgi:hypothetical protein
MGLSKKPEYRGCGQSINIMDSHTSEEGHNMAVRMAVGDFL